MFLHAKIYLFLLLVSSCALLLWIWSLRPSSIDFIMEGEVIQLMLSPYVQFEKLLVDRVKATKLMTVIEILFL